MVEGKISQLRRDVDDEVDFPTVSFHTLSGEYIEREHKTGLGAGMYSINQPVKVRYSVEDPYQFRINKGWEEQVEILFLFIFMVMALWIAFAQISD